MKKIEGQISMKKEEKNITDALSEEELSEELQRELSMAYEDVPSELYSSVMAKIEIEKKKKRTAFIRTLAGACAAAFVFAASAIYVFSGASGNSVADNYALEAVSYDKAKSLEENDGIINEDEVKAPAEPEIGDVMLCRIISDAAPEINGASKPLAEYQSGRILVVKDGGRYFVSDIYSGEDVYLSVFVADIIRAEKYLSSKYGVTVELVDNNDFCFTPRGILIQGEYVFPWDMLPEEAFIKYAFGNEPAIAALVSEGEYEILITAQAQ